MKKLFCVILVAALALSLAACGGSKPEDAVKGFLDCIKKWDFEGANEYVYGDEEPDFAAFEDEDYAYLMDVYKEQAANITYELGETQIDGDSATVSATITYTDGSEFMSKVFNDVIAQALSLGDSSDVDFDELMEEAVNANKDMLGGKTASTELQFELLKDGGKWKLSNGDSDALANIITANMMTALGDLAA